MSDASVTLVILAVAVAVFVWNRLPVGIVALGVALALWATGIVTLEQALAGFGSPTVVLIAALFVVAEALDAAGITAWAGQWLVDHAGTNLSRLLVLTMAICAVLSALITPNGSVAALFPMVVVLAVRLGQLPSRLLLPLAFAAHAGSLLVLTGSPVNILASDAAVEAGERGFSYFEFALVGMPVLVGTVLVTVLFGSKLLPERTALKLPRDLSALPRTLGGHYMREGDLARLSVAPGSPLIDSAADALITQSDATVHVISVLDVRGLPVGSGDVRAGDTVIVRAAAEDIDRFAAAQGLTLEVRDVGKPGKSALVGRDVGVAEVVVAPRSNLIGAEVFPGMVTE
ncbi:MAG: SLC13 family permease, partial [Thermomicrobiales bacterium]|nr:SLC13 family permease [Thermomicrobiales bacterium]